MKILAAMMTALILIFSALSLVTSNSAPVAHIAYGDTASGLLNDQLYEWAYEFEGEIGDVVLIELESQAKADYLDAQVYLIHPNGDYSNANLHRTQYQRYLLGELTEAGTYTVVVERGGGRRAGGAGAFDLSLERIMPDNLDSAWEGVLDQDLSQGVHLFYAEGTGTYRIDMGQANSYTPALQILSLVPGTEQLSTVGDINIAAMGRVSLEVDLQGGTFYVVLVSWPLSRTGSSLPYSIRITPVDVPIPEGQLAS